MARIALAALSGVLLFLSCANFDIWPLAWVGIVPLLVAILDDKRPSTSRIDSPFFLGWVTGLFANGGGFYWINGLLQRFGHMPLVASAPIFGLLIAYQALTFGIFAWIVVRLRERTRLPIAIIAPVTMTALELVVPFIFPWYLAITQAWIRPVIQVADLTGPLGVTFLLVLSNAALYETISPLLRRQRPPWRPLVAALATTLLVLAYGQVRIAQVDARRAAAPRMKIGVVQANLGINESGGVQSAVEELGLHQRLSASLVERGADLIVWPESSYPFTIGRKQRADFPDSDGRRVMRGFHKPLLFGALTRGADSPYPFNSALLLDENGEFKGRFDKNFLLVFGEYIPYYEQLPWFQKLVPNASNLARGSTVTTFTVGGAHIGPMICYEDIIPSFARRLVAERPVPNLFINITNDAWFGDTSEPWEHLALSVYRAVENRVDLVRAVNTGVSAFVDATGRIYEKTRAVDPVITPGVEPATLLGEVAIEDASGIYGGIGDLFGLLNLMVLCGLGVRARRLAGAPIGWRAVLLGCGIAVGVFVVGAFVVSGPGGFVTALHLWAHRPLGVGRENESTFALGARLIPVAAIACFAIGYTLRRLAPARPPRLEASLAAIAGFLAPVFLVGRLEGETAGLVFTSIGAVAMALLGLRLGGPAAAPATETGGDDPKKAAAPTKRRKGST